MNIQTFPSRDVAFQRAVERVVRQRPGAPASEIADELRPLYPRVAIFQRPLSGEAPRFYAYRDGRFEPEPDDEWWTHADTPFVTVSVASGRLVEVSDAWASFMRGDARTLLGRHFTDFLLPEAREAGRGLFEAVAAGGEVRSRALIQRDDGTTVPIEFRALRDGGAIRVSYRELP